MICNIVYIKIMNYCLYVSFNVLLIVKHEGCLGLNGG